MTGVEFGCASGKLMEYVLKSYGEKISKVRAIDYSEGMVKLAQGRLKEMIKSEKVTVE